MSLTLQTTSATSCVGTSGIVGPQPLNGTITVSNIMETTTFAVTCQGPNGTTTAQTQVVVVQDAPTVTLTAASTTIASGAQTTLSWNSTGAQTCVSSGGWSGTLATSGSQLTGPLTATTDFSLLCTGPGGSATQSVTVTVDALATLAQLVAVPSTVAVGSVVSLNYSESNATSCTLSGGGLNDNPALPSGSVNSPPINASTTFTLTCTGAGGDASQSATVSVIQSVPTVSISAGSSTIPYNTATSINWTSTNATGCTASGAWSGSKPLSGSVSTGALTHNETYVLTCTGPGGSASQTVTVTTSATAPTVSLSASPSSITSGGSSTLTWSVTNATSCTASGSWNGSRPTSGSQSTGPLSANVTYALTCTGPGGSASQSATVSVSAPAPTVTLSANPSTVASGDTSTLTWVSTNATSCTASGGWSGSEAVSGSVSTPALTSTTMYTLSCTGAGGSAAQSATVTVSAPAPVVTIAANPTTVKSGSTSTLTWSSTNAKTCNASNGWTGAQPTSGSQTTVPLSATTKFVLTCTGDGGTARNSATVSVTVTPPTVSLSASPSSVAAGGSSTLTWSSTNADTCAASGAITGPLPTSGTQTVNNITAKSTYTLTCTNSAGSNSISATVAVTPTISGTPSTTATVGTAYSFTPVANGGLGAILTFTIQHMPSWASFNPATGALTGTPSAPGTFSNIKIGVTDGITSVDLPAFSITVGTGGGGSPGPTCSATSGALNLNAKVTRSNGISPLFVFFDATGTTDSALTPNTTAFQDVTYTWNFGDAGASGTDTWAYGSNPGVSSKNLATGGIAGHLYITNSGDINYTATVTATDGANTAMCHLAVTAYDPSGSNGFPGAATTCVSSSGTPVAGSGGCPVGATVSNQSSFVAALSNTLNGKRILFKCGDTFSGDNAVVKGQKFSVGAYGSCVGTTNNRPIFSAGGAGELQLGGGSSADFDGRFADLDLQGNNSANAFYASSSVYPYQITLVNINSSGNQKSFYDYNASQIALVEFVMNGMGNYQGIYVNNSENQCANGSHAYSCGGNPNYENVDYQALMGSLFNGTGVTNNSNGIETVRISACRLCVIENNEFENANAVGAVLKLHNGNPSSQGTWIGQYTELVELSDNLFTGISGAQLVEIAPQNGVTDERLRDIVFERNLVFGSSGGSGKVIASVQNGSFRDNIFNGISAGGSQYGLQLAKRGVEWTGTPGAPVNAAEPQYNEAFNNTCYGSICIGFSGADFRSAANDGWAKNNLMHNPGGGSTVTNSGSGNAVSNNTTAVSNDPGFANSSGSFRFITDYTPTAFYSGGTSAPVFFDAMGAQWSPTWDLGALHP